MALRFQNAFVPATAGMDQSVHDRVLPVQVLRELTNGEFNVHGDIAKRGAFEFMSKTVVSGGNLGTDGDVRGIFSTGRELVVMGARRLFAYNFTRQQWYDRGPISPYGGELIPRMRDERTFLCPDIMQKGSFIGMAAQYRTEVYNESTGATTWKFGIELVVYDENDSRGGFSSLTYDDVTIGPQLNIIDSDEWPHSPRMLSGGNGTDYLILMYGYGDNGNNPHTLKVRPVSASAPDGGTEPWLTLATADLWADESILGNVEMFLRNGRTFDGIDAEHSNHFALAWIDNTNQHINVRTYNAETGAAVLSAAVLSTNAPYMRVAMCKSRDGGDEIYIAAVADTGGEGSMTQIEAWSLDVTDLSVNWGPVVVHDYTSGPGEIENLGIAHDGTNDKLCVSWVFMTSNGGANLVMGSRTLTDAGVAELASVQLPNLYCYSRPFYRAGRPYVACTYEMNAALGSTSVARIDVFAAYCAQLLVDLDPETASDPGRTPKMAGLWGVGESAPLIDNPGMQRLAGANNAFEVGSTGVFRIATNTIVESMTNPYVPNTAPTRQVFSLSADEVVLDFNALPTATRVGRRAFVLGGGYLSYYDGDYVHELGFGRPPFVGWSAAGSGHGLSAGDYIATAVYEHTKNGTIHRSAPAALVTETATANQLGTLQTLTLPCSHRRDVEINIAPYVSDINQPVPKLRMTSPFEVTANDPSARTVSYYYDESSPFFEGPPVYTSIGNDLSNVSPSGALIVSTALERLFTARHHAKDLVGFSDPFAPGTEAEDLVAPELNDAFVKIATDGEEITFVQEMDDNVIIGTTSSIYALTGEGPDNAGLSSDFPPLRRITTDRGCINRRSVITTPDGIMFESDAGIYMLTRGFELEHIGDAVRDELVSYPLITSATLVAKKQQVRFTCTNAGATDGIILVFDYKRRVWSRFVVGIGESNVLVAVGSCVHDGKFYAIDRDGNVRKQELEAESVFYDNAPDLKQNWVPLRIKGGWFQPAGPGSWERVASLMPMLSYKTPHNLKYTLYSDWETTASKGPITITHDQIEAYPNKETRFQPDISVTRQLCQAFSWELEDEAPTPTTSTSGQGYTYTGATVNFGFEKGRAKTPAAQRS